MVSKGKITIVKKDYIIPNIKKYCEILNLLSNQARNQEFLRAGEVFENKGTSINI